MKITAVLMAANYIRWCTLTATIFWESQSREYLTRRAILRGPHNIEEWCKHLHRLGCNSLYLRNIGHVLIEWNAGLDVRRACDNLWRCSKVRAHHSNNNGLLSNMIRIVEVS